MSTMLERTSEREGRRLDEAGTQVSTAVHKAILRGGEPARKVADALHGTWLGHPLHAVLTDVVIGAWMSGSFFDAVGVLQGSRRARRMGDALAAVGTAAAVPTALSGLVDFSTFPQWSARPATLHGMLNTVVIGMYTESLRLRRRGRHRGRALALSWLAQGLMGASAWLGGEMVYKHKVGVSHAESFDGPEDWTAVLEDARLTARKPRRVELDGKGIMLFRQRGRVYAIGSVCSHAGGPLEKGKIRNGCVTCPWHDSVFDLRDGSIVHGPATQPQARFETRVMKGKIEIRQVPRRGPAEAVTQSSTS